ncbi:MAG: glycosyltransferase [Planctomycetota bacterium]
MSERVYVNRSVAITFSQNAAPALSWMHLIRWVEIGNELRKHGVAVHLVTDRRPVRSLQGLPLLDAAEVDWGRYDVIKTCFPRSIDLVPEHPCIFARMGRPADDDDSPFVGSPSAHVIRQQRRIRDSARYVVFHNPRHGERWRRIYGDRPEQLLVPTGCPETIPPPIKDPYPPGRRVALFCGSLTTPHMVNLLNQIAERLHRSREGVAVHLLGRNLIHRPGSSELGLEKDLIHTHPPTSETEAWQYLLHADVGLALAHSNEARESEQAKIYYYLRAGLPVVTESTIPTRHLVEESGHGRIVPPNNPEAFAEGVLSALSIPPRQPTVMRQMADLHGWHRRTAVYLRAINQLTPQEESNPLR